MSVAPHESVLLLREMFTLALSVTIFTRRQGGATGPPLTSAFPLGEINKTAVNVTCETGKRTGFLFPVDYD